MRWLIDEMLPPALADELSQRGHDAVAVFDLDMQGADDDAVFERAVIDDRIVVTENFADFVALVDRRLGDDEPVTPVVFVRKASFPSGGALAPRLADHLDQWSQENPDPYRGIHWP